MVEYNASFILLHISAIMMLVMFIYIIWHKNWTQINIAFLSCILFMFFWNIGVMLNVYAKSIFHYEGMIFENIAYIGACFSPVSILFIGLIFANVRVDFSFKHLLLFIIPIISTILLWTNKYHHLFYIHYSDNRNEVVVGQYFIVHIVYSYVCILIGLYYLLYFSIKNSGFFSKQSFLIILGTIVPLMINILYSINIGNISYYATPVAFSFSIACFSFAIIRYKFLNIAPIALQTVVDLISDSFLIINDEGSVIDYNKAFVKAFGYIFKIKRNDKMINIFSSNLQVDFGETELLQYLDKSIHDKTTISFEKHIKSNNFDKHFTIEITPIFSRKNFLGTIILFKDITQNKKDLEIIKENQTILLEQERLASLGQLISGIAHNIKTPIMSLSGGIEALKDLVAEYRDSISDKSVTEQDHYEIVNEMQTWLNKMKPYCTYMSDIITAVKGQAVQMNDSTSVKFTVDELIKRIELLLKHELKKYHCLLKVENQIDMNTEIKGEVNNLVQVFDNIIINAIDAYEGRNGIIELNIIRSGDNVEFSLKDYAKGIPKHISSKLFKEMITTKGKNGTGLGLYMSYSTIKGRFGGNMSFSSKEGSGTTFYISVPCITYGSMEESK